MTVIAIINADTDPHIIADCLLSADGEDRRETRHVWIPSLGLVPTDWKGHDGPWHVVRMGRKTIVLPNNGGLLAFAGDCRPAFKFWALLSEKFNVASGFDQNYLIDSTIIDQVLMAMGEESKKFHILGIIIDADGNRKPYVHRLEKEIVTENIGTCYLAGSGTNLLASLIESEDQRFSNLGNWAWEVSPAEDAAESLCSRLLYLESDINNGRNPDTPMHERFGGYYEWYGVKSIGINPIPVRVDLNIVMEDDRLFITRFHLPESLCSDGTRPGFKANQILLRVLSFALERIEVDILDLLDGKVAFVADKVDGVVIEQLFYHYDRVDDPSFSDPRMSYLVPQESLREYFEEPFVVGSLRLIVKINNFAIMKGVRKGKEILAPVTIRYSGGRIEVVFDQSVGLLIADMIVRHADG